LLCGVEKPAAIWEDTYYTFIIIKMAAFTYTAHGVVAINGN
jgi:hypothetical protein